MNTWVTVVLTGLGVMLVLGGICLAGMHKMYASKRKILTELNSFVGTTVIPELKPVRETLDQAFTAEEKQKIDELRAEAKELAGTFTALHEKYHKSGDRTDKSISDADLVAVKQSQKTMRRIISESWIILDNHEAEFDALAQDIMPSMERWHTEMKERVGKFMPRHRGHSKFKEMHKAHARFGDALVTPVLFILFEPETNFPFGDFQASLEKHLSQKRHHKKFSRR